MRVSTCLGRRGSGVQIAPPRPIESVAYGHLGRPLKTAVDEFVAVVALKIHLLNTLGSAPVIPPQWRNDRGPSLKFNQESDPLCPRRGYGQFFPLNKSLRINGSRRKRLQCANWPVDDSVSAQNLTHSPAFTTGRQKLPARRLRRSREVTHRCSPKVTQAF